MKEQVGGWMKRSHSIRKVRIAPSSMRGPFEFVKLTQPKVIELCYNN